MIDEGHKKRVLVVEDDHLVEQQLVKLFEAYNEVEVSEPVSNATEALEALRFSLPDLLVLDLMLPYGDRAKELHPDDDAEAIETGIHLLEWLNREYGPDVRPPVLVVTARSDPEVWDKLDKLLQQKDQVYLKPFDTLEFEFVTCEALGIPCKLPPPLIKIVQARISEEHRENV